MTYFVPLVLGLDVRLRRKNSRSYPGFECQHRVYCRHQRPVWGDGERGWGVGTTLEGTFGRATPGGDTNSIPFFHTFNTHLSPPRLRWHWLLPSNFYFPGASPETIRQWGVALLVDMIDCERSKLHKIDCVSERAWEAGVWTGATLDRKFQVCGGGCGSSQRRLCWNDR